MTDNEQATLALMVLLTCRDMGLTQAQVLHLFSRKAVDFVYALKRPQP